MDVPGSEGTGAEGAAVVESADSSFAGLAAAAVAGLDQDGTAQAVVDPPAEGAADEPIEGTAVEGGTDAVAEDPAATMQSLLDEAGGEAMKLDPEKVPESLRPFLKGFQADYTRKTQAAAETARALAAGSTDPVVAALRTQLEQLQAQVGAPAPVMQPAVAPAPESDLDTYIRNGVAAATGAPILEWAQVAESDDPRFLQVYMQQQNMIAARQAVAEYHRSTVAPTLGQTVATTQAMQQASQSAMIEGYFTANADLLPYADSLMAPLVQAGASLEQAGAQVRDILTTAKNEAIAAGIQLGREAAKAVSANQEAFSVPSSSTQGKAGGPQVSASQSFQDIAKAGVEAAVGLG